MDNFFFLSAKIDGWSLLPNELLDEITYKLTNKDIALWGLTFPILVGRSKLIFNACALHQRELDKDYGEFQYFNQKMFDNLLLYTSYA